MATEDFGDFMQSRQAASSPSASKDNLPSFDEFMQSRKPSSPKAAAPDFGEFMQSRQKETAKAKPKSKAIFGPRPSGLITPGTLDWTNRPVIQNADGSHSTDYSVSMADDKGHEVLVPTVVNGKFLTPDGKKPQEGSPAEKEMFKQAWANYQKTGGHFGIFDNAQNADAYAGRLHNRDAKASPVAATTEQTEGLMARAKQPLSPFADPRKPGLTRPVFTSERTRDSAMPLEHGESVLKQQFGTEHPWHKPTTNEVRASVNALNLVPQKAAELEKQLKQMRPKVEADQPKIKELNRRWELLHRLDDALAQQKKEIKPGDWKAQNSLNDSWRARNIVMLGLAQQIKALGTTGQKANALLADYRKLTAKMYGNPFDKSDSHGPVAVEQPFTSTKLPKSDIETTDKYIQQAQSDKADIQSSVTPDIGAHKYSPPKPDRGPEARKLEDSGLIGFVQGLIPFRHMITGEEGGWQQMQTSRMGRELGMMELPGGKKVGEVAQYVPFFGGEGVKFGGINDPKVQAEKRRLRGLQQGLTVSNAVEAVLGGVGSSITEFVSSPTNLAFMSGAMALGEQLATESMAKFMPQAKAELAGEFLQTALQTGFTKDVVEGGAQKLYQAGRDFAEGDIRSGLENLSGSIIDLKFAKDMGKSLFSGHEMSHARVKLNEAADKEYGKAWSELSPKEKQKLAWDILEADPDNPTVTYERMIQFGLPYGENPKDVFSKLFPKPSANSFRIAKEFLDAKGNRATSENEEATGEGQTAKAEETSSTATPEPEPTPAEVPPSSTPVEAPATPVPASSADKAKAIIEKYMGTISDATEKRFAIQVLGALDRGVAAPKNYAISPERRKKIVAQVTELHRISKAVQQATKGATPSQQTLSEGTRAAMVEAPIERMTPLEASGYFTDEQIEELENSGIVERVKDKNRDYLVPTAKGAKQWQDAKTSQPAKVETKPSVVVPSGEPESGLEAPAAAPVAPEPVKAPAAQPAATEAQAQPITETVREAPETIQAQVDALRGGHRLAVMVYPDQQVALPEGYERTSTKVGDFIHKPNEITAQQIGEWAERGDWHKLLGIVEPKSDKTTKLVVSRDPKTGVENQAVLSSPENAEQQKQSLERQFPGSTVEIKDASEAKGVVENRQEKVQGLDNAPEGLAAQPSAVWNVDPRQLHVDPARFQWRVLPRNAIPETEPWDQAKAGPIDIWRDPQDGKWYVIEGHHRQKHALHTNTPQVEARVHEFENAAEAKQYGALRNIELGNATAFDAALYLRESGLSVDDLKAKRINLTGDVATRGAALARLSNEMWEQYRSGAISEPKAVAIGHNLSDPVQQKALAELAKNENLSAAEWEQLARQINEQGNTEIDDGGFGGLFGSEPRAESNAVRRAKVAAKIERELSFDKTAFKAVATERRAQVLSRAKNVIDVTKSGEQAVVASAMAESFRKLQNRMGPVNDLLTEAAKSGEKPNAVFESIYPQIRQALINEFNGGQTGDTGGMGAGPQGAGDSSLARRGSLAGGEEVEWGRGLPDSELSAWADSKSLVVEDAGNQGMLFGDSEQVYRFRKGGQSALVYESDVARLVQEGHPNLEQTFRRANLVLPGLKQPWEQSREAFLRSNTITSAAFKQKPSDRSAMANRKIERAQREWEYSVRIALDRGDAVPESVRSEYAMLTYVEPETEAVKPRSAQGDLFSGLPPEDQATIDLFTPLDEAEGGKDTLFAKGDKSTQPKEQGQQGARYFDHYDELPAAAEALRNRLIAEGYRVEPTQGTKTQYLSVVDGKNHTNVVRLRLSDHPANIGGMETSPDGSRRYDEHDVRTYEQAKELLDAKGVSPRTQPTQQTPAGAKYYRGTEPGRTEKISTGDSYWDSKLFVADQPKHARNYGSSIEQIQLKPDAKILREGTSEFRKIVGAARKGESLLDFASRATKAAEAAGYDAIHFQLQGTVGTAIINRNVIESRSPYDASDTPTPPATAGELESKGPTKGPTPVAADRSKNFYSGVLEDEGRPVSVVVDRLAMALIQRLKGERNLLPYGVSEMPAMAEQIARAIREQAGEGSRVPEESKANILAVAGNLEYALSRNKQAGVSIIWEGSPEFERTRKHEDTHAGQRAMTATGAVGEWFTEEVVAKVSMSPEREQIIGDLKRIGYSVDNPAKVMAELEGYIYSGDMGSLTPEQARMVVYEQARALYAVHGNKLDDPPPIAQDYIDKIKEVVYGVQKPTGGLVAGEVGKGGSAAQGGVQDSSDLAGSGSQGGSAGLDTAGEAGRGSNREGGSGEVDESLYQLPAPIDDAPPLNLRSLRDLGESLKWAMSHLGDVDSLVHDGPQSIEQHAAVAQLQQAADSSVKNGWEMGKVLRAAVQNSPVEIKPADAQAVLAKYGRASESLFSRGPLGESDMLRLSVPYKVIDVEQVASNGKEYIDHLEAIGHTDGWDRPISEFSKDEKEQLEKSYGNTPIWEVHTDAGDVNVQAETIQEAQETAATLLGQNLAHGVPMERFFNKGTYSPTPEILQKEAAFMQNYKALKSKKGSNQEEALTARPDEAGNESGVRPAYQKFLDGVTKRLRMESNGQAILDSMEDAGESVTALNGRFWGEVYDQLPPEVQDKFNRYARSLTGWEPGSTIAVGKDGGEVTAKDWKDIGANLDLPDEAEYLEGEDRGLVALMRETVRQYDAYKEGLNRYEQPSLAEPKSRGVKDDSLTSSGPLKGKPTENDMLDVEVGNQKFRVYQNPDTGFWYDSNPELSDLEAYLGPDEQTAKESLDERGKVQPMRRGPGAQSSVLSEWQRTHTNPDKPSPLAPKPETGTTDIGDLTDSIKRLTRETGRQRKGLAEIVEQAIKGTPKEPEAEFRNQTAWEKVKVQARSAKDWYLKGGLKEKSDFRDALKQWHEDETRLSWELDRFVNALKKALPDRDTRIAVTNWIEADGNKATLQQWATDSKPKFRKGYEDALKLTPEQLVVAENLRAFMDAEYQANLAAGILKQGVPNYVQHMWRRNKFLNTLLAGTSSGLKKTPSYVHKRMWPTYFEGEKQGGVPIDKDIAYLVANHHAEFGKALASRAYLRRLMEGYASDGRPLVALSGSYDKEATPGGSLTYFVNPQAKKWSLDLHGKPFSIGDYKEVNSGAMRGWRSLWTDPTSKSRVVLSTDLVAHPEIAKHLKANLESSVFRDITVTRAILELNSELKQVMTATFIPVGFHGVTVGVHGMEHGVIMPIKEIDLDGDPKQLRLVHNGVTLNDFSAKAQFRDGVGSSTGSYISKLPGMGKIINRNTDYLFGSYIPRLKMSMALKALDRNLETYAKDIKSGKVTEDQIYEKTAMEANAAFGGLNYKMLGRHRTTQDLFSFLVFAPDFFEARARFVGQALMPYGREQLRALALGAIAMYTLGRVLNQVLDDDPHWDKPFSVVYKGHEYHLRSIQGDVWRMALDAKKLATTGEFPQFLKDRVNPVTVRIPAELLHRKSAGEKLEPLEEFRQFLRSVTPIPMQAIRPGEKAVDQMMRAILASVGIQQKAFMSSATEQAKEYADKNPRRKTIINRNQSYTFKQYMVPAMQHRLDESKAEKAHQGGKLSDEEYNVLIKMNHRAPLTSYYRFLTEEQQKELEPKWNAKERETLGLPPKTDAPKGTTSLPAAKYLDEFEKMPLEQQQQNRSALFGKLKEIQSLDDGNPQKKELWARFWKLMSASRSPKEKAAVN